MHAKQLGNLGELKVAADLARLGYYVFTELGDICKADLIVMDETYIPIKVQVKAYQVKNGKVSIKSSKDGPGYHFNYEDKHSDVYAIYIVDRETICYISNIELISMSTLTIRIDPPKNNQAHRMNWAHNYSDFKKALRDSTWNT